MGTIKKSDLDPEVAAYVDGVEAVADNLADQVAKAEQERDEALAQVAELAKSAPAATQEEIRKAAIAKADPAIRAILEDQQAQIAKSELIAKTERDARLEREFISKAEALPAIPGERTDLAGLLRRASEVLSKEDAEQLDTVLKAANAQLEQSDIFKSLGQGGGETTISKSINTMAEELRKSNPALTIEQATMAVYDANPELAAQALNGEGA